MATKICITCSIEKNISEYTIHKNAPDGLRYNCKSCRKLQAHEHYLKNKEKYRKLHKEYHKKNIEKIKELSKRIYEKNKTNPIFKMNKKQYDAEYHKLNYEKIKKYKKIYKRNNIEKVRASERVYRKNKKETDLNYKIRSILRSRISAAIKNDGGSKSLSSIELLGCSIEIAKKHIESKFKIGMSWKNWNHKTWHIDHIKPLASFDLTKPEEQKKAFHFSNLQPLWAEENLKKGAKHVA